MKVRSLSFPAFNRFDCQFKDLNCNEMNALRGGTDPPLPPTGGDDWIIDILAPKKVDSSYTTTLFTATTLTTTVTVYPLKKPKKK